jgi:cytidylate kinase
MEATYQEVLANIQERDRLDSSRSVAPLRQAEDSIVLDNSNLTVEEQFDFLLSHARRVIAESQ